MGIRKNRGRGHSDLGWVRSAVGRLYTEDQLKKDLFELPADKRLTIIASMIPKININENNGLTVRILLDGIQGKVPIQGKVVAQDALPEHDSD